MIYPPWKQQAKKEKIKRLETEQTKREAQEYVAKTVTEAKLSRSVQFEMERDVKWMFDLSTQQAHDAVYQGWPETGAKP